MPPAETQLSVPLVREFLRDQHPSFAHLPLSAGISGWDNDIYRLGEELAVRLPRRAAAVALLENEQRWLPQLQPLLPVRVPAPIAVGKPQRSFPWKWSITPWFEGETVDQSPLDQDQVEILASFLDALHTPAPAEAPHNPWRSTPLPQLQPSFDRCVLALAGGEWAVDGVLLKIWERAVSALPDVPPTWVHGDLHARNVLARRGRICAVIDWGDMAKGDPAADLAATWMLLPQPEHREQLMRRCTGATLQTWNRARGLAMLYALNVLRAADPEHVDAGLKTLQRLRDGP